jgi:hypothetical protein
VTATVIPSNCRNEAHSIRHCSSPLLGMLESA